MLENLINVAENNILQSSISQPMHGVLVALRVVISEIDFLSPTVQELKKEIQILFDRLVNLAERACKCVLFVLVSQHF
jgi:hypothetical protein